MKLLVATTNINKVLRIKRILKDYDYEILSLKDIEKEYIEEPEETKDTPIEIALEKAIYYANKIEDMYILCQDDTLVLEGIKDEDSPGMHIKGPVRKKYGKFTDELACEYYVGLANKYGGRIPLTFNYGHAIARKISGERNIIKSVAANSTMKLMLVNEVRDLENNAGYFLNCITDANINGVWKHYTDLTDDEKSVIDNDLKESILTLLDEIQK